MKSKPINWEGFNTCEEYNLRFMVASKAHDSVVVKRGSGVLRSNSFFGQFYCPSRLSYLEGARRQ